MLESKETVQNKSRQEYLMLMFNYVKFLYTYDKNLEQILIVAMLMNQLGKTFTNASSDNVSNRSSLLMVVFLSFLCSLLALFVDVRYAVEINVIRFESL